MLVAAKMTQEQPLACWLRDHLWHRRGEERLVWNTVRAEHCSEDVKEWISNPSFDLTSSPPFLLRWLQVVAAGSVCTLMNKCDLILLSPDLEWNHNRCSSRCVYYSCNRLVDGFLQCLKKGGGDPALMLCLQWQWRLLWSERPWSQFIMQNIQKWCFKCGAH